MSKQVQDAYIVAATRTPIGKAPKGALRNVRPDDLLVHAIRSALAQVPALDPKTIEDAIVGCAIPEAEQGLNVARIGALLAGLPDTVGGVTVNRFCASGLTAIAMAADRIRVGEAEVMIAAGTESMSMVPMMGNKPSINPRVFESDENLGIAYGMGLTAEKVAQQWKVTREAQDAFALASHQKAIAAQRAGEFADEISPIEVVERFPDLARGVVDVRTRLLELDEGPRADTTLEALAKLRAVFAAARDTSGKPTGMGSVTAGNSSQTSDGAGALILVSERILKQFDLKPLARFVSFSVRGVPPKIMGIGPKEAIPAALKVAGLKLDDLGWIELNEAFAAQALAVIQDLGLNPEVVNPMGGAIALGHPLGATGAIRAATVVHALRRRQLKYGMVTMCVGTGMGAAGIFERT
ncbi:MAG: acetyl-CoA C-acyltransferase [Burkholderiales bacterium]|nr:acetyl-CoA C-acyltransferase [Burkholderiales bacterium]OJX05584.1 MAG: acetyl-CoA acetyltransferase [Burkholderiales bacterium 70-64]